MSEQRERVMIFESDGWIGGGVSLGAALLAQANKPEINERRERSCRPAVE